MRVSAAGCRVSRWGLAAALVGALVLSVIGPLQAPAQGAGVVIYTKKAKYDDVKFELNNAIVGRGLTIDFNGQVSKMLDRTGADVGSTKAIYKQAEYVSFCSAKLSRQACSRGVISSRP